MCVCVFHGEACLVCSQVSPVSRELAVGKRPDYWNAGLGAVPTVLCPFLHPPCLTLHSSHYHFPSLFLLAVTPSPIAGHWVRSIRAGQYIHVVGPFWQLVTSNLKSLMTIQLEFLPLLKIMACSIYSLSMRWPDHCWPGLGEASLLWFTQCTWLKALGNAWIIVLLVWSSCC